jgi:hypothetical protein
MHYCARSMLAWLAAHKALSYRFKFAANKAKGVMCIRITYNRRIHVDQLKQMLTTKPNIQQQDFLIPRQHDDAAATPELKIVKSTFTEADPKLWGGSSSMFGGGAAPTVVLEYDEQNSYLLTVTIQYNPKNASKNLALNPVELQKKIELEFKAFRIWDKEGDDHSAEMLAVDKRKAIDARAEAEKMAEAEGDEEDE